MSVDNGVPVSEVRAVPAEAYDVSSRSLGPLWPDEVLAPIDDTQRQIGDNVVLGYD
jgi:hypothetical protein